MSHINCNANAIFLSRSHLEFYLLRIGHPRCKKLTWNHTTNGENYSISVSININVENHLPMYFALFDDKYKIHLNRADYVLVLLVHKFTPNSYSLESSDLLLIIVRIKMADSI